MAAAKQPKFNVPTTRIILSGPHSVHWIPCDTDVSQEFLKTKLHAEELKLAKAMKVKARRDEFCRGRWLFHKVTKNNDALLRAASGEPKWPEATVASISHKEGHVMFCQVPNPIFYSIGLDLEKVSKVKVGFEDKICSKEETELIDRMLHDPFQKRNEILALIFSYKEAVFKSHFFLGKKHFGFHDATILSIDLEKREIKARLNVKTSELTQKGHEMLGFYNWVTYQGEKFVVATAEERRPEALKPLILEDEEDEEELKKKAKAAKAAAERDEDDEDDEEEDGKTKPKGDKKKANSEEE